MALVQVSRRTGVLRRQKRGADPVVELHLEDGDRIVAMWMSSSEFASAMSERKTVDWTWVALIETRL